MPWPSHRLARSTTTFLVLIIALTPLSAQLHAQDARRSPKASPELRTKVADLIDEVFESEVELKVGYRRSKILRMKHDVIRAAVADPSIIEFVAFGAREVEVIGKETGSTTLTLWMGTPQQTRVLSMVVTVTRDKAVDDMRRMEYGELQVMINEMFPDSKIQLIPIADKLIVRGQVRDESEANKIMAIIQKNSGRRHGLYNGNDADYSNAALSQAADPFPDAGTLPSATVVSMLNVPGEKQIMLKVRIAEISRSGVRRIGTNFQFNAGDFFFSSLMATTTNALFSGTFDADNFDVSLSLLSANGCAKILAEPNLVTISGETATFLSGGEFAVPTVVGVGGAQAATTTFKGFGTELNFTPTVLDKDRIRLKVNPSFSTLNNDNAVNGIFGTDTRTVTTTVDLREGQVLAIAGLIQEQTRGDSRRIPGIGDWPLVGIPFSHKSATRDETELIVIVSPELVHAIEPENAPTILPGMEVTEPGDIDFFINGDIEGDPNRHHRSTVWYMHQRRMKRSLKNQGEYYSSENYYIHGPHGFSE